MIECFSPEVRDHLPDLVHGRLGEVDTATMLAHIEACDACAAEVELLRAVRREAAIAPVIDVSRVVAALPAPAVRPTVEAPARTGQRVGLWKVLTTAAVVAIVAVAGTRLASDPAKIGVPSVAVDPVTAEANSVAVPATQPGASLALVAAVDDLTDDEIEELLGELDAIETIPSAEPEPAAIGIGQNLESVR